MGEMGQVVDWNWLGRAGGRRFCHGCRRDGKWREDLGLESWILNSTNLARPSA